MTASVIKMRTGMNSVVSAGTAALMSSRLLWRCGSSWILPLNFARFVYFPPAVNDAGWQRILHRAALRPWQADPVSMPGRVLIRPGMAEVTGELS